MIGMLLGNRYQILEKIGEGGMSDVYKAKCSLLNRFVAVKILKKEFLNDAEIVRRFNIESQAAASLTHPNVVSIYDVGCEEDVNYIVMEYVEGMTLKEYIRNNAPLSWIDACGFALQISSALECAHRKHIVHRDIKPHNIIITNEGTLKVTDFGIARAATSSTIVANNSTMGSVHYLSPEQARGNYTDERSDIYSLGVVMYEMLAARVPFDAEQPVSVALMHVEKQPESIISINPSIPEKIENIVSKAMAKEQTMRYQSVTDLMYDLRFALSSDNQTRKINNSIGADATRKVPIIKNTNELNKKTTANDNEDTPAKKSSNVLVSGLITAIVIVITLSLIGYFFFFGGVGKKEETVPNLIGITIDVAKDTTKNTKFTIKQMEDEYSDQYEAGLIISQLPKEGVVVKTPYEIQVVVSKGKADIVVPNVTNKDVNKAKLDMQNIGLEIVTVEQESETLPVDVVIRQVPSANTNARKGDTVTLYISKSPEKQTVVAPSLINMTLTQAKAELQKRLLKPGQILHEDSEKPLDTVIRQAPVGGETVDKDTEITLVVSTGKSTTSKPAPTVRPTATTTATPQQKTKTLTFSLPQDGRENINVVITANGKEIYNKTHAASDKYFEIKVSGSSSAEVKVFYDNKLATTQDITFN